MNLKKVVAEATIAGALGFTALWLGPAVANANPAPSDIAQTTFSQDDPDWQWDGEGDWPGGCRGWCSEWWNWVPALPPPPAVPPWVW